MTGPDTYDRDTADDAVLAQLGSSDTLDDRPDPVDEGWSPAERPWAMHGWGTTAREVAGHEALSARLAREVPESPEGTEDGDGLGDATDTDGELRDDEVGNTRSGRLRCADQADDGFAVDVGVDGAGASAEEAAVHLVETED